MTKIMSGLIIKAPDMFLRKIDLIQEYVFLRIKNSLTAIKDSQQTLKSLYEFGETPSILTTEFHKNMISMSKQDISCFYSVVRDMLDVMELESWKEEVLLEASKVLFKD